MRYDSAAITRALDLHRDRGLIKAWQDNANARWKHGTERPFFKFVTLTNGDEIELRNMREAWIFVHGLATAAQAFSRAGLDRPPAHNLVITAAEVRDTAKSWVPDSARLAVVDGARFR